MFVAVRMQFHNHVDTASVRFRKGYAIYVRHQNWNIASVHDISLRKCSGGSADLLVVLRIWWFCGFAGGSADLRTSEGTLVTRESARFDKDSETKSQVGLLKFHKKSKIF